MLVVKSTLDLWGCNLWCTYLV